MRHSQIYLPRLMPVCRIYAYTRVYGQMLRLVYTRDPHIIAPTLLSIAISRFAQWRRSILTMIIGFGSWRYRVLYGKQNEINKTAAWDRAAAAAATAATAAQRLRYTRMCHVILCVCERQFA